MNLAQIYPPTETKYEYLTPFLFFGNGAQLKAEYGGMEPSNKCPLSIADTNAPKSALLGGEHRALTVILSYIF